MVQTIFRHRLYKLNWIILEQILDYKYDLRDKRNLSLCMDFYELTMCQCYFDHPDANKIVTFDLFYRRNPDNGAFAIFAGLEQVIGYIQNLHFSDEDIEYEYPFN